VSDLIHSLIFHCLKHRLTRELVKLNNYNFRQTDRQFHFR